MKRVKLILEYDLGTDWEDYPLSENPEDWQEYFRQSENSCDMEVVGVKIEEEANA